LKHDREVLRNGSYIVWLKKKKKKKEREREKAQIYPAQAIGI